MQKLLNAPTVEFPDFGQYLDAWMIKFFSQEIDLLPLGFVENGQLWISILSGKEFIHCLSPNLLLLTPSNVATEDPLRDALSSAETIPLASVGIIFSNRRRNKIYGRSLPQTRLFQDDIELCFHVTGYLGNCPKYINCRQLKKVNAHPRATNLSQLDGDSIHLIENVDLFYIASVYEDMDVNHRGGPPGFVRILDSTHFVYPEYSGNRLYQTLGNLKMDNRVGITFPDFEKGHLLMVTGIATILMGEESTKLVAGCKLSVIVEIQKAIYIKNGLGVTGTVTEFSPYNPPVQYLRTEKSSKNEVGVSVTAELVKSEKVSPTLIRSTFSLSRPLQWKPGQYGVFDFSEELDSYRHMDDYNPSSLNDNHIRTFTIASSDKLEIVTRATGEVTSFLRYSTLASIKVNAIGGEFILPNRPIAFVAGGIGITPLLASLPAENVRLFWSLNYKDLKLLDMYDFGCLQECNLFITGANGRTIDRPYKISYRRMNVEDLQEVDDLPWYFCGSPGLKKYVSGFTNKEIVSEDFSY